MESIGIQARDAWKGGGMNEHDIEKAMRFDYSAGTEEFREKLLAECLDALDIDDEIRVIPEQTLDLLAAAGDPHAILGSLDD